MPRRPLTLPSAVSLLLLAATALLWVRSYSANDWLLLRVPAGWADASSARGRVKFQFNRPGLGPVAPHGPYHQTRRPATTPPDATRLRGGGLVDRRFVGLTFQSGELLSEFVALTVPYAYLALLFWMLPTRWAVLRARRAGDMRRRGLCPRCGYDLRASRERCPECGEAVPQHANA